nr:adenosylcobinamide-GDP ribazoletransferase [Planomonospora venezuelensis]
MSPEYAGALEVSFAEGTLRLSGAPLLALPAVVTVLPAVAAVLPAVAVGLAAAWALRRRAVRRLGGITGDVLGALVETAATAALVTCAILS